MPTQRPRITVTLNDDIYATLSELASLQKRSLSLVVYDLLELTNPVNKKIVSTIKRIQNVQIKSKAEVMESLNKAQDQAEAALVPLMAILDSMAAVQKPPTCNTGVTLSQDHSKLPSAKGQKPSATPTAEGSRA